MKVLIADDQPDVLESLRLLLKSEGYGTEAVTSPASLVKVLKGAEFDAALIDLNYTRDTTSGREGLELLTQIQSCDQTLPVVVMTAWGTVELAIEAMKRGARDFVLKPWENAHLLDVLRTQISRGQELRENRRQQEKAAFELEEAAHIQRQMFPREFPKIAGHEIFGTWQSAGAVGGDYFGAVKLEGQKAALCIADVAGKGLPAALLMSSLRAAMDTSRPEFVTTAGLVEEVNRIICAHFPVGRFITCFYCVLDAETQTLLYTNAGHNAPILMRADGTVRRPRMGGPVLGVFPNGKYECGVQRLASGDRLLLFTDGLSEARNAEGEEFGEERLVAVARDNRHLGAEALQKKLAETVAQFSAGRVDDDATLVVVAVQ